MNGRRDTSYVVDKDPFLNELLALFASFREITVQVLCKRLGDVNAAFERCGGG